MNVVVQIGLEPVDGRVEIASMNKDLTQVSSVGGDGVDEFSTSWKTYAHRCGLPVKTEHLPTQMTVKGRKRNLPDFFPVHGARVISPDLKALIEEMDPGMHQFEPVTLSWKDKSVAGEWFWFIPTRRMKSLREDMLNPPLHPSGMWFPIDPETMEHVEHDDVRIVFDKNKVGDVLLWCDPALEGKIFSNPKLLEAMAAKGMPKMKTFEFELV